MNKHFMFASVISEIEQSDVFMTVRARILETPEANLNGCRVTDKFVSDIISNKERYVGLPLYADKKALISGSYDRLGHLYDSRTGEFHSTQIGSFYDFEREDFGNGSYLVGYARIPKRDKNLSKAIAELFAEGKLKFSFEIACGEYSELDDGTIEIDASENNYLEGTAIVTFPACEDAVALEFVAQRSDDTRKGDEEMAEEKVVAEETVEVETAAPHTEDASEEVQEETEEASCKKKNAEEEVSSDTDRESAEVCVVEHNVEVHETNMYDTETGREVSQKVIVETTATDHTDGNIVSTDEGITIAEEKVAEDDVTEVQEESTPEYINPPDDEEKLAEVNEAIKKLTEMVETLTAEVQALKKTHVNAEVVNPFMGEMTVSGPKYSLLEKAQATTYSLLSK